MSRYLFIVLFFALALWSCSEEEEIYEDIGVEADFNLNKQYILGDGALRFRIINLNDSRCSEGATCVWEGEARFEIVTEVPKRDTIELSTYDQKVSNVENYIFELIEVSPYPVLNTEILEEEYIVRLLITK